MQKRLEGAERVALLAVGSDLRGDDAAGLLVADYLEKDLRLKAEGRRFSDASVATYQHTTKGSPLPSSAVRLQSSASALPSSPILHPPSFLLLRGHTAPENCTGAIKRFAPTHLVVVDAADLGQAPGTVVVLEPGQIAGVSFSTHQLPLSVLLDYLKTSIDFEAVVIAIQPAQLHFGQPVTPSVRRAARRLATALAGCVQV